VKNKRAVLAEAKEAAASANLRQGRWCFVSAGEKKEKQRPLGCTEKQQEKVRNAKRS